MIVNGDTILLLKGGGERRAQRGPGGGDLSLSGAVMSRIELTTRPTKLTPTRRAFGASRLPLQGED